jgi:hypothetical protein
MATGHPIKPVLSRLALIGGIAAALAAMAASPAAAQNVPWVIQVMPARTLAVGCQAVISLTARSAVERCLAKVGVTPIQLTDFVATATPVCKTTHVAISSKGIGYVYSNQLSRILRPACA